MDTATTPTKEKKSWSTPVVIDVATGPTPEQTDAIITRYETANREKGKATETERDAKHTLIQLVKVFGHAAAGSEHSSRIEGALNTALVTDVTTTSLDEEKIRDLHNLLIAQQREELFFRIFGIRTKHELLAGAEDVFRTADMPKWLRAEAKALFGECIKVSQSAPRVKVYLREKEPKQRKPRTKKAVAA